MPASVAATAAMEATATSVETTATAMEAATSVETTATAMEATVTAVEATVTAEPFVVKSAATITITTTVIAPAIVTTAIETPAVESMEPRASPDEDSVEEPIRAVVTVRRASVWVIIIVAIGADRCRANVSVCWANSNAHDHSLCVRERCRTQSDAEQSKNS
jgi:hypothetical protein